MVDPDLYDDNGSYAANIAVGLAKLGISFDAHGHGSVIPPAPPVDDAKRTAERLARLAIDDGFIEVPGGRFAISQSLARQLHHKPAGVLDELQSLDEVRHE
jgi:hypothetical protein